MMTENWNVYIRHAANAPWRLVFTGSNPEAKETIKQLMESTKDHLGYPTATFRLTKNTL